MRHSCQRHDYELVLTEKRGTCSTKHAILMALANENGFSVELLVGIFLMTESNTLGIGSILERYNLGAIPEAHCYLRYKGDRFDVTFPGQIIDPMNLNILREKSISPTEIGAHKVNIHQEFARDWIDIENLAISQENLWRCREECIRELGRMEHRGSK